MYLENSISFYYLSVICAGLGLGSSHGRIVVGDVRTASPAVGKLNIGDIFVEVSRRLLKYSYKAL